MERLERLFRCQLEATSSSLWMMSGILAMLKRDGFNPSTPGLFNTFPLLWRFRRVRRPRGRRSFVLSVGSLSWRTRRSRFRSRRSSCSLSPPGSDSGLFDVPLLDSVAAQVKEDSLVSSSLAVSKALSSRSGSKPLAASSSPLAGPSGYRPPRLAQRSGKRSASSRSGGRKRFKGGKGSAPSSKPSGFRK